jgi:hypothetical protein
MILGDLADESSHPPAVLESLMSSDGYPVSFGGNEVTSPPDAARPNDPGQDGEKPTKPDSGYGEELSEPAEKHPCKAKDDAEKKGQQPQAIREDMVRNHRNLDHLFDAILKELEQRSSDTRGLENEFTLSPIDVFDTAIDYHVISDVTRIHNIKIPTMPNLFYNSHPSDTLPYSD